MLVAEEYNNKDHTGNHIIDSTQTALVHLGIAKENKEVHDYIHGCTPVRAPTCCKARKVLRGLDVSATEQTTH